MKMQIWTVCMLAGLMAMGVQAKDATPQAHADSKGQCVKRGDLNRDGKIGPLEQKRMERLQAEADTNKDGVISDEERAAMRERMIERRKKVMEEFDADKDGTLNEDERAALTASLKERREAKRKEMLAKYDKDGDGVLNQEERQALHKDQPRKKDPAK